MKVKKGRAKTTTVRRKTKLKLLHPHGNAPFGPSFFTDSLPKMIGSCPVPQGGGAVQVNLFLGDGTILDVCQVVALAERYCVVAAYEGTGPDGLPRTQDDVGLEALPYDLILRAQVRAAHGPRRLGFSVNAPMPPVPVAEATTDAKKAAPDAKGRRARD